MTRQRHRIYSYSRLGNGHKATMTLARGLGWLSVGRGTLAVIAPAALARFLGMRGRETLVQAYGVRELATGGGILASRQPRPWLWGRVAGDALDLATLLSAFRSGNPRRVNVGLALLAVAGVTVLDVVSARALAERAGKRREAVRDYSDRVGLGGTPEAMRGRARDTKVPPDMRTPGPLRPLAGA